MCLRQSRLLIAVFSVVLCVGISLLGCETSQAHVSDIPIEGAICYVRESDNSFRTYIDIVIGKDFAGNLPDDIDNITVTGPSGDLPISKDDFTYIPQLKDFWIDIPGSPEIGTYTFTVTSGNRSGSSTDTQSALRRIPLPDTSTFKPAKGQTLICKSPTFSWSVVDEGIPLYYRIEIKDIKGNRIYRTDYVKDMLSIRLPPDLLKAWQTYRWRVRVADGANWIEMNNRSHSRWLTFSASQTQNQCEYKYKVPAKTDDGWETSSLSEEGIDSEKINQMVIDILNEKYKDIHSIVLVKNGKLILEEYFSGYHRDKRHTLQSVTKSVTSILVGIAIDRKMVPDVDVEVYELFPEYRDLYWSASKKKITLRHVLTMTPGLEWTQWGYPYPDPRNSTTAMVKADDWLRFVLEQKATATPGQRFTYSNGSTMLLGGIIKNSTASYADTFAEKHLFGPLGISDYRWDKTSNGTVITGWGLWLRPRDMAKIGYLFMREGDWNGTQVVSKKWVHESTKSNVTGSLLLGSGYGYQWWRGSAIINDREIEAFYAAGRGGQYIFIIPELDLVAAFTSQAEGNPDGELRPHVIMSNYIIPAVLPPAPLRKPKLSPMALDRYEGEYKSKYYHATASVFQKGGRLYSRSPEGDINELFPATRDRFYATSKAFGNYRIDVVEDEKGDVAHAVVRIGFASLQFDKIKN